MNRFHVQYLLAAAICAIIIFIISSSAAAGVVYVRWNSPGAGDPATFDGSSWDTAFHKVQEGLDAASSGDEVWVAAGTYAENIVMKDGVALYGGFTGAETALAQRNWKTNETLLDGGRRGSVVTVEECPSASTRVDGFTITNGAGADFSVYSGGGIHCLNSSPTIANNAIQSNHARFGSAILCRLSSPTITGNTISQNTGTSGAIYLSNASPTITRNRISDNQCGGVDSDQSSPQVLNNEITGNKSLSAAGGITIRSGSGVFANNLIARNTGYNTDGILVIRDCLSAIVANNTIVANTLPYGGSYGVCLGGWCTFANNIVALNTRGITGPKLGPSFKNNIVFGNKVQDFDNPYVATSMEIYRNYIEDPLFVNAETGDYHIQAHSPCVDRGDDTVVGTGWTDIDGEQRIFGGHVDIGADESLATQWPEGASVKVSPDGNDAYSGMSWARPKRTIQAAIDLSSPKGGEVWVKAGTYRLDSFNRITLRPRTRMYGGFRGTETIRDLRNWNANPTILDGQYQCTVITAQDTGEQQCVVDGFTIRNGRSSQGQYVGGGVLCLNSKLLIRNNRITSNATRGIYCSQSSSIHILNNRITDHTNCANSVDIGVLCNALISNNVFSGNSACVLSCNTANATIINNTFIGNLADPTIGCSTCGGSQQVIVANNIIAFNLAGLSMSRNLSYTIANNCFFGNTRTSWGNIPSPVGTNGNISVDPEFVDRAKGDYRLLAGSPCIDKGSDTDIPSYDLDGTVRPQDGDGDGSAVCDIGAYERPLDLFSAKSDLDDGSAVTFGPACVTAVFPAQRCIYVENTDRSTGIRIDGGGSFAEGQVVNVRGTLQTDTATGERYVVPSAEWPRSADCGLSPRPVTLINRMLGGGSSSHVRGVWGQEYVRTPSGTYELRWVESEMLNNIGLLVTVFGRVTARGEGFFYLDDGSDIRDGIGGIGVRVIADGIKQPAWNRARVTGISSCMRNHQGYMVRVLRVRKQEDIAAY